MKYLKNSNRTVWTWVVVWTVSFSAAPLSVNGQEAVSKSSRRDVIANHEIEFPNSKNQADSLLSQMTGERSGRAEEDTKRQSIRKPIRNQSVSKSFGGNDFQAASSGSVAPRKSFKRTRQYPVYKPRPASKQTERSSLVKQQPKNQNRIGRLRNPSEGAVGTRYAKGKPRNPSDRQRLASAVGDATKKDFGAEVREAVSVLEKPSKPHRETIAPRQQLKQLVADVPIPQNQHRKGPAPSMPSGEAADSSLAFEATNTVSEQTDKENVDRLVETPVEAEVGFEQLARRPSDVLLNMTQENLRNEIRRQQSEASRVAKGSRAAEGQRQENVFNSRLEDLARRQQEMLVASVNKASDSDVRMYLGDMAERSPRMSMFANEPGYDTRGLELPARAFKPELGTSEAESSGLNTQVVESVVSKTEEPRGPIYVKLSDAQDRTAFGSRNQEGIIGAVGDVESESISDTLPRSYSTEGKASVVSPTELWLNNKSRYNGAKINPSARGSLSESIEFEDPADQAQLDSTLSANYRKSQEEDLDDESTLPNQSELLDADTDEEGQKSIERNRDQYRRELYRPLSVAPVSSALNYVDDKKQSIIATENQQLYLVGFNGFYENAVMLDHYRMDHFGNLWTPKCAVWKTPDICYQPLYYEDANLERFGARYPKVQPAASSLHFFASTVLLPYKFALDPYWQCEFSAGYGRPGNRYCYKRERLVWDLKAGSFQALLATAMVFAIP